jgi:hypothetical protein
LIHTFIVNDILILKNKYKITLPQYREARLININWIKIYITRLEFKIEEIIREHGQVSVRALGARVRVFIQK